MKTLFYIFLVAFLVAMLGFFASILTQSYPVTAEVVSIDQDRDLAICETYTGIRYEIHGVEDWQIGDCASLWVWRGEVLNAKYGGWTLVKD